MGDSRFHLNVKFSIYGEDYEWDCSLNYSPDGDHECDARISEWFGNRYREAHAKWEQEIFDSQAEQQQKELEVSERQELDRLMAKYSTSERRKA